MRTEVMLEHFGVTEANWRDGTTHAFLKSKTRFQWAVSCRAQMKGASLS